MGNYYAYLGNECIDDMSLKILIKAHIDEIGFQVEYIDDSGFIYIRKKEVLMFIVSQDRR